MTFEQWWKEHKWYFADEPETQRNIARNVCQLAWRQSAIELHSAYLKKLEAVSHE